MKMPGADLRMGPSPPEPELAGGLLLQDTKPAGRSEPEQAAGSDRLTPRPCAGAVREPTFIHKQRIITEFLQIPIHLCPDISGAANKYSLNAIQALLNRLLVFLNS